MIFVDYILWGLFVLSMVILVSRFSERFPKVLDVDVMDPLSVFEMDDEDGPKDICPVCERKKGSEPLLICQTDENCINKDDKH
jgi:hypothetical protein